MKTPRYLIEGDQLIGEFWILSFEGYLDAFVREEDD